MDNNLTRLMNHLRHIAARSCKYSAASLFAAGQQTELPGISVAVVRLARSTMKRTAMLKVCVALIVMIPVGIIALGAGGVLRSDSDPDLEIQKHVNAAAPLAKPKAPVQIAEPFKPQLRGTIPSDDGPSEGIFCVAYSPDGKTLLAGNENKDIDLWDTAAGKLNGTLLGHTGIVWSVAFSPDGKAAASGSYDTTIKLWDSVQTASY